MLCSSDEMKITFLSDKATLNTDAANSSNAFVPTYQSTRRDILEHPNLHRRPCEN